MQHLIVEVGPVTFDLLHVAILCFATVLESCTRALHQSMVKIGGEGQITSHEVGTHTSTAERHGKGKENLSARRRMIHKWKRSSSKQKTSTHRGTLSSECAELKNVHLEAIKVLRSDPMTCKDTSETHLSPPANLQHALSPFRPSVRRPR